MTEILVPLAEGCEEIEAVTLIDLLRRAGINVVVASLHEREVTCAHGIRLLADVTLDEVKDKTFDMVVLPGGQPGSDHLNSDPRIHDILRRHSKSKQLLGAICAAPKVLVDTGVAANLKVTAYPGVLDNSGAKIKLSCEAVEKDGLVMTSRSPGTAMDFALEIIEVLKSPERRRKIEQALMRD